jgi:hypothetical protein
MKRYHPGPAQSALTVAEPLTSHASVELRPSLYKALRVALASTRYGCAHWSAYAGGSTVTGGAAVVGGGGGAGMPQ